MHLGAALSAPPNRPRYERGGCPPGQSVHLQVAAHGTIIHLVTATICDAVDGVKLLGNAPARCLAHPLMNGIPDGHGRPYVQAG